MATRKWEEVAYETWRLKVPGGWLYRYREFGNPTMAFVPEPVAQTSIHSE